MLFPLPTAASHSFSGQTKVWAKYTAWFNAAVVFGYMTTVHTLKLTAILSFPLNYQPEDKAKTVRETITR